MPTTAAAAAVRITDLVDTVRRGTVEARAAGAAALRAPWVPQPLADVVGAALAEYTEVLGWVLDRIDGVVVGAGFVDALDASSTDWSAAAGRLDAAGGDMLDMLPTIADSWEGRGGAGYAEVVGPQAAAADRSAEVADGTARATAVLAGAGGTYYLALAVALAGFAAAVSGLPRSMASATTAPAALAVAASAAGSLISYVGDCAAALERQVNVAAGAASTLTGSITDPAVFATGRWPDPAAGLNGSGEA